MRDQVFVSYSHDDRIWLERLKDHLAPSVSDGVLKLWDDSAIAAGDIWLTEIRNALAHAKVAVLLVSPSFLGSAFIAKQELPPLLQAAQQEGLCILWVPVRDSLVGDTPLSAYQSAWPPDKPLAMLTPAKRDTALVHVARTILAALREPAATEPPAATVAPPVGEPVAGPVADGDAHGLGFVLLDIKAYRAAFGYAGLTTRKREGDGATPQGRFRLRLVMYRPDRESAPPTSLPVAPLAPESAWCDDPDCPSYNTLVTLPHAGHSEPLWRADNLYDVMAVVGYNDRPAVPGLGSAIFLHIARPHYEPTVGCIGLDRDDLLEVLGAVGPTDEVEFRS